MNLLEKVNKFIANNNFLPWEMWGSKNEVFITYQNFLVLCLFMES